jgi:hypothetical protein
VNRGGVRIVFSHGSDIVQQYLIHLPKWTHIRVEDEIEPPAPYETQMTLSNMISTGETIFQPFVSPAVLQANETGALIMTRDIMGTPSLRRTRKVAALGFEPTMRPLDLERERDILLDWAGKHPPRRRHRTLSVPGIDFSYDAGLGIGNSGIFGADDNDDSDPFQNAFRLSAPDSSSGNLSVAAASSFSSGRSRTLSGSPFLAWSKQHPPPPAS